MRDEGDVTSEVEASEVELFDGLGGGVAGDPSPRAVG